MLEEAIILCGLAGTGKSTLAQELGKLPEFYPAVSYTTRDRREGEVEGKDYYFLDKKIFREKYSRGEFFEVAKHGNDWYAQNPDVTKQGIPIFVLNNEGIEQIRSLVKRLWIFHILIDDKIRAERLKQRGDSLEEIAIRLRDESYANVRPFGKCIEITNYITTSTVADILILTGRVNLLAKYDFAYLKETTIHSFENYNLVDKAEAKFRQEIGEVVERFTNTLHETPFRAATRREGGEGG